MASFEAKIGWEWLRKRENKNYRADQFLPNSLWRIPKKIGKKFKKLKNTIMVSFQAKISWKSPRKNENKNYHSDPFLSDAQQKISNEQQKNSKN